MEIFLDVESIECKNSTIIGKYSANLQRVKVCKKIWKKIKVGITLTLKVFEKVDHNMIEKYVKVNVIGKNARMFTVQYQNKAKESFILSDIMTAKIKIYFE